MSALHHSDVFFAYISDEGMYPPKYTICLTPTSDPIGLWLPCAGSVIRVPMDSTDSVEREDSERDTNSAR